MNLRRHARIAHGCHLEQSGNSHFSHMQEGFLALGLEMTIADTVRTPGNDKGEGLTLRGAQNGLPRSVECLWARFGFYMAKPQMKKSLDTFNKELAEVHLTGRGSMRICSIARSVGRGRVAMRIFGRGLWFTENCSRPAMCSKRVSQRGAACCSATRD